MLSAPIRLIVAFVVLTVVAGCSSTIRFVRAPGLLIPGVGQTDFAPLLPDEGGILVMGLAATQVLAQEHVWLVRQFDDVRACTSGTGGPRCSRASFEGTSEPIFFATFLSPDALGSVLLDTRSSAATPGDAGVWMLSVGLFRCTLGVEAACRQVSYQGVPLEPRRILAHRSAQGADGVVLDELWATSVSDEQLVLCTQRGSRPPECSAAMMGGAPVLGAYEAAAALPAPHTRGHVLWVWAPAGLLRCTHDLGGPECRAARFDTP